MTELIPQNEPSIARVTLPTGETAPWFYNPESTCKARFATKVVFHSQESAVVHTYVLLLTNKAIDEESVNKSWSIAEDLTGVGNHRYKPVFSDAIFALDDCTIAR